MEKLRKEKAIKERREAMIREAKVAQINKSTIKQKPEEQESRQQQIKRRKKLKRISMATDKFDLQIYKYRELVATDSVKARECIKRLDYKNNFYLLKCIAQTYLDESRFEDGSNTMRKEVDFRRWRMAEKYIIRAFNKDDDNAETLYTMGEIRKLGNQNHIAIYCFERIIKLGINTIVKQPYSRGNSFAKGLINDAKFELYRLFFYENPKLSAKYLREYKSGIKKGNTTIFKPLNKFLL
jgi:tetratricopeptide (TPR) repeat protein